MIDTQRQYIRLAERFEILLRQKHHDGGEAKRLKVEMSSLSSQLSDEKKKEILSHIRSPEISEKIYDKRSLKGFKSIPMSPWRLVMRLE